MIKDIASPVAYPPEEERTATRWPAGYDISCATMSQNVDKARHFIEAYNRRDFDAAVEWFDPQVEWVLPARQSFDSCQGPDEIERFWKGLDETMDVLQLEPQEFVEGFDFHASGTVHYTQPCFRDWRSRWSTTGER